MYWGPCNVEYGWSYSLLRRLIWACFQIWLMPCFDTLLWFEEEIYAIWSVIGYEYVFILHNLYGCHYELQKEVIMCFCNVMFLPYQQHFGAFHIKFSVVSCFIVSNTCFIWSQNGTSPPLIRARWRVRTWVWVLKNTKKKIHLDIFAAHWKLLHFKETNAVRAWRFTINVQEDLVRIHRWFFSCGC